MNAVPVQAIPWAWEWEDDRDQERNPQAPKVGLSYQEIADELGIAKSSVRHIERVALAKLRAQMGDWR